MDEAFRRIIEGSPLIVLILGVGVYVLWYELLREREKRVEALITTITLGNTITTALKQLADNVDTLTNTMIRDDNNGRNQEQRERTP